jgi:hypothetical protein
MTTMIELQQKIESLPKDKILHFCTGMLLALPAFLSPWFLLLPVLAGIGKEFFDKYIKKAKFDLYDLAATILGALPVLIILTLGKIV